MGPGKKTNHRTEQRFLNAAWSIGQHGGCVIASSVSKIANICPVPPYASSVDTGEHTRRRGRGCRQSAAKEIQTVEPVGRGLPPVICDMRLLPIRNCSSKIIGWAIHISVRDLACSVSLALAQAFRIDEADEGLIWQETGRE